jgi:hypothetical protein
VNNLLSLQRRATQEDAACCVTTKHSTWLIWKSCRIDGLDAMKRTKARRGKAMLSRSKPFAGRNFPLEHVYRVRYLPSSKRQVGMRITSTITFRYHKRVFVLSNPDLSMQLPTPTRLTTTTSLRTRIYLSLRLLTVARSEACSQTKHEDMSKFVWQG